MGCGCNKKKKAANAAGFKLRMPNGKVTTHKTRLEAETANAKGGGGGKVSAA